MFEGLLVDLVPFSEQYEELQHKWQNSEAAFWGDMGDRHFHTKSALKRHREHRAEWRDRKNGPYVGFGIQTKDGQPIGLISAVFITPHNRTAMLGALIGESTYWGGGYGTDALMLMLDYGFDWLDLHKLWLMTMSLNARVIRQMEKVGFTLEGRMRDGTIVDGVPYDGLYYGMLREEWPGRVAMVEKLGLRPRG
jgi:RimJ/RimL family protein N-acetyltransferase